MFANPLNTGRGGGIRTHGLLVPNQARYQLRYTPERKNRSSCAAAVWLGMRGSNSHGRSQSPLHYHYANPHRVCVLGVCPQRSYIIACPMGFVNAFFEKTSIFSPKFSVFQNSSLLRQSFSVIRCRWISLTAGGTFIPWAISHNSKCRYSEQGAASAGAVLKSIGRELCGVT